MTASEIFAFHEASTFLRRATVAMIQASVRLHVEMHDGDDPDRLAQTLEDFDTAVGAYHAAISRAMAQLDDPDSWTLAP